MEHPVAITQWFTVRFDESRFLKDEESALFKVWSEIMFQRNNEAMQQFNLSLNVHVGATGSGGLPNKLWKSDEFQGMLWWRRKQNSEHNLKWRLLEMLLESHVGLVHGEMRFEPISLQISNNWL